jgi:glutamate-ammonia-ligase adenylyltransferase
VLPDPVVDALRRAYAFLRRTENRLQMVGERQDHRLPLDAPARRALARSLGFAGDDPAAAFEEELEGHRVEIRAAFAPLFAEEGVQPLLDLFLRTVPQLLALPGVRQQIEELAVHFARAIDASPNRERAMNNLDRFIRGLGARRFYYGLLLDRPELVDRLANLFASSEYLSGFMATHPRLIEPIFSDPNVLVLSRDELRAALAQLAAELPAEEPERSLAALRRCTIASSSASASSTWRRRSASTRPTPGSPILPRCASRARSTWPTASSRGARRRRLAATISWWSPWASSPAASSPTAATST